MALPLLGDALTTTPRAHNVAVVAPLVATAPRGAALTVEGTGVECAPSA